MINFHRGTLPSTSVAIKTGINIDMRYYWETAEQPSGKVLDLLRYKVAQ